MISLTRYRNLLQASEVREIFAASLIGRLPIGITGLAILLFVQTSRGSFAEGGAAAACYVGGLSVAAPLLGRLIDRYGPRGVLLAATTLFPAALIAFVWAVEHLGTPALLFAAGRFRQLRSACALTFASASLTRCNSRPRTRWNRC